MAVNYNYLTIIDTMKGGGKYSISYNSHVLFDKMNYALNENTLLLTDYLQGDFLVTLCPR